MKMRALLVFGLAVLLALGGLAFYGFGKAGSASRWAPADATPLPAGAVILPESETDALLNQCSRHAPAPAGPTWRPSPRDILRLEAQLPAVLRKKQPQKYDPEWSKAPGAWHRQYVGVFQFGHRVIYGNYFVTTPQEEATTDWRTQPWNVCDGGPRYFGVEYDVAADRIERVDYNGWL